MGIEIIQFGMTFEDFLGKSSNRFYNKSHNTKIIPCRMQRLDNELYYCFTSFCFEMAFIRMHGGLLYEKKIEAYHKTLEAFQELSKYNAYSRSWREHPFLETLSYPLTHKSFFYVNASWMYNYWQKIDNGELKDMVPAELPTFKPSDVYFGGYSIMWAVPKNAPHKDMAVKFLLSMTKPDVAEKWTRYTKCPTGLKGTITNVSFGRDHF
jgi:ABC-type glycerol-3-phosphate transport system substrate-binding protein